MLGCFVEVWGGRAHTSLENTNRFKQRVAATPDVELQSFIYLDTCNSVSW